MRGGFALRRPLTSSRGGARGGCLSGVRQRTIILENGQRTRAGTGAGYGFAGDCGKLRLAGCMHGNGVNPQSTAEWRWGEVLEPSFRRLRAAVRGFSKQL